MRRGRENVERAAHDLFDATWQEVLKLPEGLLRGRIHVADHAGCVGLEQLHRRVCYHFGELLLCLLIAGQASGDEVGRQHDARRGQSKEEKAEPTQPLHRGHHLGLVDFRNQGPADRPIAVGVALEDRDRRPRREHRHVAVIVAQGRARLAGVEGAADGDGVNLELRVDDRRFDAKFLREPGVGAEHPIGADGVGLASLAQACRLADDVVGLVERQLERQHADDRVAVEERRRDEARGVHQGRQVAAVLAVGDGARTAHRDRLTERLGQIARGERAGGQRRSEVDLFEYRIEDRARGGIDEEDVIHTIAFEHLAEDRVQRGVGTGVGGAVVGGVEQLLRPDGVRVPTQVAVLQHHAAWGEGVDGWPHVDLRAVLLAIEGRELRGIVAGEFLPRCRYRLVVDGQFLPRLAKLRQRFPRQRTTGGDEEFLTHRREIPLD